MIGEGGATAPIGSGRFSVGVHLNIGALISAGGDGSVTVKGTGGAQGGPRNDGIWIDENGPPNPNVAITSTNGDVFIVGIGGGEASQGESDGVDTRGGEVRPGGKGNLSVIGSAKYGIGIQLGPISVPSGNTKLIADTTDAYITPTAGETFSVVPYTAGVSYSIGGPFSQPGAVLSTDSQTFSTVSGATINIGDANTGPITVSTPIVFSAANNLNLTSASDIAQNALIDTHGGNLTLSPGPAVLTNH